MRQNRSKTRDSHLFWAWLFGYQGFRPCHNNTIFFIACVRQALAMPRFTNVLCADEKEAAVFIPWYGNTSKCSPELLKLMIPVPFVLLPEAKIRSDSVCQQGFRVLLFFFSVHFGCAILEALGSVGIIGRLCKLILFLTLSSATYFLLWLKRRGKYRTKV